MKSFKRFVFKCICFLSPFLLLVGLYFYNDPFKVLRAYKTYDIRPVFLNESYIGWHTYLNNRDSLHFNSFILGNSCTMAYKTGDWEKYLPGGRAIRLFGNAESLDHIYRKLKALDRLNAPIANVLFILDKSSLEKSQPTTNFMLILPPEISGSSKFSFQFRFFQGFLNPDFLVPYLDYLLFHHYRPYMEGIINPVATRRNLITNDMINPKEDEIRDFGENYWKKHQGLFYPRDAQYREFSAVLSKVPIRLLEQIDAILKKHRTHFKIVINPDYSQRRLNPADLAQLRKIFGPENVFDFSGINAYSDDIHNFYEPTHYRDTLGRLILKRIYACPPDTSHVK